MINTNKTYTIKQNEQPTWYIIDANDQILGRLSSTIAKLLKGKNNISYRPDTTNNIYVIVINATAVNISGRKKEQKLYKRHSGRPGGMKIETFHELQMRKPIKIVEKSIRGMLPKNKLGKKMFTQLKVYPHNNHPYAAQKPNIITL